MSSLGKIIGSDWLELQYISSGAIAFTQEHLTDLNRIADSFGESLSEAFHDVLKKGLEGWLQMCDIMDSADRGERP